MCISRIRCLPGDSGSAHETTRREVIALKIRATLLVAIIAVACLSVSAMAAPVETYYLNNYATAPAANAPGYAFTYESLVQSPGDYGGMTYDLWWYDYYLENNSTTRSIVSWTWAGGNVIPNTNPGVISDGGLPLAAASSTDLWDAEYCEENFEHELGLIQVASTVRWDDGHTACVDIYVPGTAAVPEPSSLMVLAFGAVPMLWRRRK